MDSTALEACTVAIPLKHNKKQFCAALALAYGLVCTGIALAADATPAERKPEVIRVNETRTNLLLFPTGDEVLLDRLSPYTSEVFAAGSAGTVLSIDNNRFVFHTGRLFFNSGKNSLTIGTRLANIRLPAETTVILEAHPHKPLRIAVLSGTGPVHLKIKERRSPEILKNGEELYISDTVLPPEQYQSSDSVPRENASVESESKCTELMKRTFDARKLLAWHIADINQHEKLMGDKKAFLDKLNATTTVPANVDIPSSDPWHVLAAGGSEFTMLPLDSGVIHLRSGELFLYCPSQVLVDTPLGEVQADKGSLLAVDTSDGNLRARALTGPGDVMVLAGKNKLPVPPGEEVMVSDHMPTKDDTNPKDGVARRNPTTKPLEDRLSVTVTDFNILSLIVSADYLKPIKKPFWSQERSALEKLIQTAAAIETVTHSKGGYQGAPRATTPKQPKTNPGQAI